MMRGLKWMCGVAAATAMLSMAAPDVAEACSLAPEGWFVLDGGGVTAAPEGPFVFRVEGYYPLEILPPLENEQFDITVVDSAGNLIEGTHTVIGSNQSLSLGRVAWSPLEPLVEGERYTMTVTQSDSEFGGPIELELTPARLEAGNPIIKLAATEVEVPTDQQCCEQVMDENTACFVDNCGGESFDNCRICWNTAYEYPVRVELNWQLDGSLPSNHHGYRVLEMDELDDEVRVLAEGEVLHETLTFLLPDDADDGMVAIRLELVDLVGETEDRPSETAFLIEVDGDDDIVRIAHRAAEVPEGIDRCEPGTTVDVEPDGTETPAPDPLPEDFMPCDMRVDGCGLDGHLVEDDPASSKKDVGGCSSVEGDGSVAALLFGLVFGAFRRRRQ